MSAASESLAITTTLRSGERCQLRTARPADEAALLAIDRDVVEDGRGVVRAAGEGGAEVERFRKAIAELGAADPAVGVLVVAERETGEPRLIGEASLRRYQAGLLRHIGTLAVQVHPAAQGMGVGRLLMERVLWWALETPAGPGNELHRLELMVRADNERALALYRSLGFETECVRRGFVRYPDGRLVDDHIMTRWVPRA